MHLSNQIVEVSHVAENKNDTCFSGDAIRQKSGILPHPILRWVSHFAARRFALSRDQELPTGLNLVWLTD